MKSPLSIESSPATVHVPYLRRLGLLGHGIQSRAVTEPLQLRLVEGVGQLDIERLAILGVDSQSHGLANGELRQLKINSGIRRNAVVVGGVSEGQRKHALLLQVGLVLWKWLAEFRQFRRRNALTIRAKLRVMMARPPR